MLKLRDKLLILGCAFLGWMFAGVIMVIIPLAGRSATRAMQVTDEAAVGSWFATYICAFLLGAATGGLLLGALGDRIGRSKAMGVSILTYSLFTGLTYWAASPTQLTVLRFLACLGVGGMWPNGVALASEAWSEVSRPLLAGLIGTSANVGFVLLSVISTQVEISPESWRWVMVVGATPAVLGVFVLVAVPESPSWLARNKGSGGKAAAKSPIAEIFRPPLLPLTLIGICLGAVPLLGNWGGANWLVPWAEQAGGAENLELRSWAQTLKSSGGIVGSLLGGWLATIFGRRTTYFAISAASLATSLYLFYFLHPQDPAFLPWVFVMGLVGTVFFGWLPLYLPELFPTRSRATGSGVAFNFGRIATAAGVLVTGRLVVAFEGDYARVGQWTALVYVAGMVIILFAPDTSQRRLDEV